MKIGDLVTVVSGHKYEKERLGVIVEVFRFHGVRSVTVRFTNGEIGTYTPHVVKVIE